MFFFVFFFFVFCGWCEMTTLICACGPFLVEKTCTLWLGDSRNDPNAVFNYHQECGFGCWPVIVIILLHMILDRSCGIIYYHHMVGLMSPCLKNPYFILFFIFIFYICREKKIYITIIYCFCFFWPR